MSYSDAQAMSTLTKNYDEFETKLVQSFGDLLVCPVLNILTLIAKEFTQDRKRIKNKVFRQTPNSIDLTIT
ncbi:hypothetical protein BP00DRAFT_427269 [Aspergillus indologenus CBS 114.80]|uniref:Uncharacterized protein n=1 Tax=Aspergillus indologenus CBS 114.80 TaxID=1450541 RepID=A0A2V5IMB6_9EURO|nr:hypothetical protein BP00DRAFT_427269 [Aspergillus indologenus CBS 114.80]